MELNRIRRGRNRNLVTCSLCLRVCRGSAWVKPESVITELRSYELDTPPTLLPALCDACIDDDSRPESATGRDARGLTSSSRAIAAYGQLMFPVSRNNAFAVAAMLGDLEKAMVSAPTRNPPER